MLEKIFKNLGTTSTSWVGDKRLLKELIINNWANDSLSLKLFLWLLSTKSSSRLPPYTIQIISVQAVILVVRRGASPSLLRITVSCRRGGLCDFRRPAHLRFLTLCRHRFVWAFVSLQRLWLVLSKQVGCLQICPTLVLVDPMVSTWMVHAAVLDMLLWWYLHLLGVTLCLFPAVSGLIFRFVVVPIYPICVFRGTLCWPHLAVAVAFSPVTPFGVASVVLWWWEGDSEEDVLFLFWWVFGLWWFCGGEEVTGYGGLMVMMRLFPY